MNKAGRTTRRSVPRYSRLPRGAVEEVFQFPSLFNVPINFNSPYSVTMKWADKVVHYLIEVGEKAAFMRDDDQRLWHKDL